MIDEEFLRSLGIILLSAAAFVMLGRLIRMPAIVVYLLAGVVIGPVLGIVELTVDVELMTHIGVALLLFLVGLELSFDKIRDVGKVAIVAGIGQVVFTIIGGFILCYVLGFSYMDALFLATALTFSSTVVVVKLLDEKGELTSLYGRIAVGIFLVQDMVVIVIMTILHGLADQETMEAVPILLGIGRAFLGLALLLGLSLLASRYLLPKPFGWAARSPEMLLIWALSWCFLIVLLARTFGLSEEVGAFLAGLSLAQLPYNEDLRRRVHPLMNLFIAVFFVSLGIRLEAGAAIAQWLPTIILALFVIIGNPFIFMVIITRMGYGQRTSFLTSVTVAQISEFSFLFVLLGKDGNLIGDDIVSITTLIGVLTMAISAYMILYNHQLYNFFKRLGIFKWRLFNPRGEEEPEVKSSELKDHIIVVGMNSIGRRLVEALTKKGETVLAIDTDPHKLRDLPGICLLGNVNYLSVLEEAGIERAKLLVSALHIEDTNDMLAYRCKSMHIPCAINVIDISLVDNLMEMDTDYLMIPKVDGMKAQLKKLKDMGYLKK